MSRGLVILISFLCTVACDRTDIPRNDIDYAQPIHWDEWRFPTVDGIRLFVREFGFGDTVTILHGGWGAEHSYLIQAFAPLANRYHFIFYDQRGSLRSQCPDSMISVEKHIEDLERLREATGQKKLLLVGHSMGGFLGMSYLQRYPDKVRGLVLIASAPAKGSVKQLTEDIVGPALQRWKRKEVVDTLRAHGLDTVMQKHYSPVQRGKWHRITFSALNMHHVKNWRQLGGAFDWNERSAAIAATSGPQEWDFTGDMKKAGFPISVIHGDDDYLPIEYQQAWIPGIRNVELNVIQDAGHLCWVDQPQEFALQFGNALKKYKH